MPGTSAEHDGDTLSEPEVWPLCCSLTGARGGNSMALQHQSCAHGHHHSTSGRTARRPGAAFRQFRRSNHVRPLRGVRGRLSARMRRGWREALPASATCVTRLRRLAARESPGRDRRLSRRERGCGDLGQCHKARGPGRPQLQSERSEARWKRSPGARRRPRTMLTMSCRRILSKMRRTAWRRKQSPSRIWTRPAASTKLTRRSPRRRGTPK